MIVAATDRGLRCITQPDHARASRDILSLWRADALLEHSRRSELLRAVREHDNGWREEDAAPRRDDSGAGPRPFTAVSEAQRQRIWRRGIGRHLDDNPYVAALILEHALFLHSDRRGATGWGDFFAELESLRSELLEAAGLAGPELELDYRWLHLTDLLSLAACAGWDGSFERWGHAVRVRGASLSLEPFPLAGSTAFEVPCRFLPPARYDSDTELATALARCRWERFTLRLVPEGGR